MEMMLNFGKDDKNFARVTSITFQKHVPLSQLETTGPIDRTPGTPGSDKKREIWQYLIQ